MKKLTIVIVTIVCVGLIFHNRQLVLKTNMCMSVFVCMCVYYGTCLRSYILGMITWEPIIK